MEDLNHIRDSSHPSEAPLVAEELRAISQELRTIRTAALDEEMRALAKRSYKATIAAVALSFFAAAASIAWNEHRASSETARKEAVSLAAFKQEIAVNLTSIKQDIMLIEKEMAALPDQQHVILPLFVLDTSACELIRITQPNQIFSNPFLSPKIQDLCYGEKVLNESIRSREEYRLHNESHANYTYVLGENDRRIHEVLLKLGSLYSQVAPVL